MIRLFDILFSLLGIILLSPLAIGLSLLIMLESRGGVFYIQERVGRFGKLFYLLKFRSMYVGSDRKGLLTVGAKDNRVTRIGYFLRKYKLDELPQLINVFRGDMSLVGPRPEVSKYVNQYSEEERKILNVRPGITDPASIYYKDENEVIAKAKDPEKEYLEWILPHKLTLSMQYAEKPSMKKYFLLIFQTIFAVLR